MNLLKDLGALRILLIGAAIMTAFLSLNPGTAVNLNDWKQVLTTLVAPAMTPLVFMVLIFDFMMCRIRMSDEAVGNKFRLISYFELAVAIFLFIMWLPYFLAIAQ